MTVVKCPHCGKETQYEENEFRPFCSERCKLLDFGAWTDEEYSVPDLSSTPDESDIAEFEREFREKEKQ